MIEEQTPIPKYPQESVHEPCRREKVISTQDPHFNLARRHGKQGSRCCPSGGYEDFNFLVNSVIAHLLSTTLDHLQMPTGSSHQHVAQSRQHPGVHPSNQSSGSKCHRKVPSKLLPGSGEQPQELPTEPPTETSSLTLESIAGNRS